MDALSDGKPIAPEVVVNSKFRIVAASYLVLTFVIAAGWHLALFKDVYFRLGVFTRARRPREHLDRRPDCGSSQTAFVRLRALC